MKTIERVVTTDGGALDLATAILTIAYNLPRNPGAADSLRDKLGLGDAVVHTSETAFSYPNAVALVRDERGRKAVYLFDSDQETLREGETLAEVSPASVDPTADAPVAAGAHAADPAPADTGTGQAADEIGTGDNQAAPAAPAAPADPTTAAPVAAVGAPDNSLIQGEPLDPAAVAAVPEPLPPAGDAPRETGTSDVQTIVPGETPGHPADAVTGEPVQLSAEEHDRLAGIAVGGAADTSATALSQGFTGGEVPADGVTREATIEAAPGIGAGGEQLPTVSDPAAGPAIVGEPAQAAEAPLAADVEGEQAQTEGKARWENPYTLGTENADAWVKGYDAAEAKAAATAPAETEPKADDQH